MRSSVSLNLLKMIAVSAVITLILSWAGKQAGILAYRVFHPEKPRAVSATRTYSPVQRQAKAPTLAESAPVVVQKAVPPKKAKEESLPREDAGKKPPAAEPPVKQVKETRIKKAKERFHPNTIFLDPGTPAIDTSGIYAVQTGVYKTLKNAEDNIQTLVRKGYTPGLVVLTCRSGKKIYAVRMGSYRGKQEADTAYAQFKEKTGLEAMVVPLYRQKDMMSFCQ